MAISSETGTRFARLGFNRTVLITENWMTYRKPFNIKHLQIFFKNFQNFRKTCLTFHFAGVYYIVITPGVYGRALSVPIAKGDDKVGMKRVD